MLVKKHLFLLYLLLYTSFCRADNEIPGFFEVNYTLYSNDTKIGLMERRFFQEDDGNYAFRSESKTTGFISFFRKDHIVEVSNWGFIDSSFKPLLYKYQHTGGKKDRDVEISFNWDTGKIKNRVNDSTWNMQTEPGILDKLLYQLTIMSDLSAGIVPESYTIADGGKIKQYKFTRIAEEILKTPLGEFKTIKILRQKLNSKRDTFLWCAYDLGFLPVKVINTEKKGRLTTAIIKSLKGLGFNKK
jgi:Protein of unknown function (DUF3108)